MYDLNANHMLYCNNKYYILIMTSMFISNRKGVNKKQGRKQINTVYELMAVLNIFFHNYLILNLITITVLLSQMETETTNAFID